MATEGGFNEQCITFGQMNFINSSRFTWRTLTTWIRAYLISRYLGIGTKEVLFSRLYNEFSSYGGMTQLIFGEQFSETFTWLLTENTIALRELVDAQLDGNLAGMERNLLRLYNNAAERARLLAEYNPFWDETTWRELFNAYLDATIQMANSFATGDYSRDVEAYDEIIVLTEQIADYYTTGIFQFLTYDPLCTECLECEELSPEQRAEIPIMLRCLTRGQIDAIHEIRMFVYELVGWTRAYLISRYAGAGNAEILLERLDRTVSEFSGMLAYVFGQEAADEIARLSFQYVDLMTSMISAQIEGDAEAANEATRLLYENAAETTSLLAGLNPFWDERVLRNIINTYIQDTIEESTTFLIGDYDRNINVFAQLLRRTETTGNFLALGLYRYIVEQENL